MREKSPGAGESTRAMDPRFRGDDEREVIPAKAGIHVQNSPTCPFTDAMSFAGS